MTPENFCYWLKGYFEINDNQPRPPEYADSLNSEQIKMIKEHLDYVFKPKVSLGASSLPVQDYKGTIQNDKTFLVDPRGSIC